MKKNLNIAILYSEFNKPIVENLVKGAETALNEHKGLKIKIKKYSVPGAFELPLMMNSLCKSKNKKPDGVIVLGCIIKGDTAHFEYVALPVSINLQKISYDNLMPMGFGVLTCYTPEQAFERSLLDENNISNNKGYESARVVLEMISKLKK
ncbi:MAG: 6,7-dimethyl-8-ribityllumazine synthase [Ignavibacteria bacterium]|nr:6,7-dimethyl-8-ribityllumazine synthase [Ignavibacteria bacterium]